MQSTEQGYDYEIGIVGMGFSGIIAATELLRTGRKSFVIFEQAPEIGGVWRDNHYPGCACDIRASLYSIKREPFPDWSASYPKQPELLAYLKGVVDKYQLQKHILFNSPVDEMRFDPQQGLWLISSKGKRIRVRTAILGTGPQRLPYLPAFKGADSFQGVQFHSARWKQDVDLKGLRVAVIGTGASSIQIVPSIEPLVEKLYVFQRTPPWVLHRWDRRKSSAIKWLYRNFPLSQRIERELNFWFLEFVGTAFLGNRPLLKLLSRIGKGKIRKEVKDPALTQALTPNYELGCKRILVSDDYYPAFNSPKVSLVTQTIERFGSNFVATSDQEYEVDAILYATGFTVADVENYAKVLGLGERNLTEEWAEQGANAFLGINVSGFPNLCFLLGPNSGLSHSSTTHVIESQMHYILQYLQRLESLGTGASLDVKPEIQASYNEDLQEQLKGKIWDSGCNSWFLNKNGKNTVIFPGLLRKYRRRTRKLDTDNYLLKVQTFTHSPV